MPGLLVQDRPTSYPGCHPTPAELAHFPVVSGFGGAVFIAVQTAAAIIWFREKDVTLALGITARAVFSAEAAPALHGRH